MPPLVFYLQNLFTTFNKNSESEKINIYQLSPDG